MSLKAEIITDAQGNITIHMRGGINYESTLPLKKELVGLINTNPLSRITLDFNQVDFVGSSGISMFVEMVNHINHGKRIVHFSNVQKEFLQVFKLYQLQHLNELIDEIDEDSTMDLNIRFGNRRRTFEN